MVGKEQKIPIQTQEKKKMKRCGLYIRVSTERQAKVEEGSLKNQDQLLTQHIELKSKILQENWIIVGRYIDEGKSAKDTQGRPAYLKMIQDIEKGRIDTIICTALSRISRSTRDLLDMVDYFREKNVDFICLKEDFDTTTAQGKCFLTIMGALNEFEREQTSERTRANMLARAERGLWNGGQLLGYDLNPTKKGYIIPNANEKAIINLCFDTYLECGSILKTAEILNSKGYHTKEYSTRTGKFRTGKKFTYTSTLELLTNLSYIAKREINKKLMHKPQESLPEERRYKTVDAVWEPIIDKDKFYRVQQLLKENFQHKYNGAKPTKHFYLFNGGLLHCHKCGSQMEGRSAYGNRSKKLYYYYCCTNTSCRFKLPEAEIEGAIREGMRTVAKDESVLSKIVEKTNTKLKQELPRLSEQRQHLKKELESLTDKASCIMEKYIGVKEGEEFVKEGLAKLSLRKRQLQNEIDASEITMKDIERESIDGYFISQVLGSFEEIYRDDIKPYQKKQLLYKTVAKIELSDKLLKVGVPLEKSVGTPNGITAPISMPTSTPGANSS
jgi:site-specific DNA recombinase